MNAVLLLRVAGRIAEADELAPVVQYCVNRRLNDPQPEYWDYACAVELASIRGDTAAASRLLPNLLANMRQPFESQSTSANLALVEDALTEPEERAALRELRVSVETRGTEL